ncbi:amidotransferase [Pedobacter sp. BS3]|uniref:type 1 glutamine amidotransferase n=1 Tax=Pedobacter sp. BS3 TaxID=2567937 RepID=UPI0011EC2F17|nr:amidotransferase [Pedobacter sp. BS3]TZF82749.1 amidotransferase [Pedobacter sp. BS3]
MHVHVLQHVPFEGLGYITGWLNAHWHKVSVTPLWEERFSFPSLDDVDVLIIMGGPMGVYEENLYSWLKPEKQFIRDAINSNKKVLGICLGAQLIAAALGAPVYPNPEKEIGWWPVNTSSTFSAWLGKDILLPDKVFHWHGDTFDLPDGAVNHISSVVCKNQLFTIGENIAGIQFHLEVTPQTMQAMLTHCAGELSKSGMYIQSPATIADASDNFEQSNRLMSTILEKLVDA